MALEPMERNKDCLECGRRYFREYAGKWGVELGDGLINYAVNSSPGNIRESGNIIFPEIWEKRGLISGEKRYELQETGSSKCLTEGELIRISNADPGRESRARANKRAEDMMEGIAHNKWKRKLPSVKELMRMDALANQLLDSYAYGFQADGEFDIYSQMDSFLVDDSEIFLGYAHKKHVGLILDNAGEVMFDRFFAYMLAANRYRVSVVCAMTPKWDDVTYDECVKLFGWNVKAIPSFSICHHSAEEMNRIADDNGIDCWLAKGVMNLEAYGTDWNRPVFNSLSLKCSGVKEHFGLNSGDVPRGVITMQPYHNCQSQIYPVRVKINPMNSDRDIPESVTSDVLNIARGVAAGSEAGGYSFPVSVRAGGREFYERREAGKVLVGKEYDIVISIRDDWGMRASAVGALEGRIRNTLGVIYPPNES